MWISVRFGDMLFKWAKLDPGCKDLSPVALNLGIDPEEKLKSLKKLPGKEKKLLKRLLLLKRQEDCQKK